MRLLTNQLGNNAPYFRFSYWQAYCLPIFTSEWKKKLLSIGLSTRGVDRQEAGRHSREGRPAVVLHSHRVGHRAEAHPGEARREVRLHACMRVRVSVCVVCALA